MKLLFHALHFSLFTFHLKKLFKNSWFLALLLLGIFLATNGYIYGWDDQHVEIPLLKKLIDPTLYPNDYYVDALKANFMSYLYPVLARVITIPQIPTAYFLLYLLSRYFLFFFMFKIWRAITKQEGLAFLCVLMTLLIGRVEEFLYRTFSHQEFALALIFTGMYLFYKNRPLLAAVVLGIAANIHALYSLFPMFYISVDLMRQKKWKDLIKSGLIFLSAALPFLIWAGKKIIDGGTAAPAPPASEWIPLYQLACPQNFVFYNSSLAAVFSSWKNFWDSTGSYWLLAALTIVLTTSCRSFREDRRTQSVLIGGGILLVIAFIFSYIWPSRFFLDLNLIRNAQYMLFVLMGYLVIFLWDMRDINPWKFFLCLLALPFIRFGMYQATLSIIIIGSVVAFPNLHASKFSERRRATCCLVILLATVSFLIAAMHHAYSTRTWWTLWGTEIGVAVLIFIGLLTPKIRRSFLTLALIVPFIVTTLNFIIYHKEFLRTQREGPGFWQLQRNWIDMQEFVQKNTPKDALFLIPHDMEMGGFRIRSERTIVLSYRDCGVVGFDYEAASEWQRRLSHIGPFQVMAQDPYASAVILGISYYKVDYIIFMNYMTLPEKIPFLKFIYENEAFKLYQVIREDAS